MHPSYEIEREYAVRIAGELTKEQQALLLNGIVLEDGKASFDTLVPNGGEGLNHWYHVTLKEGRNREVRRMFEKLDLQVSRLIRIRYGSLTLPRYLRRGNFKELPEDMVLRLKESVGLGQAAK
jgi:23S rRNA pseudouridine2605 synthase